MHLAFTLSSTFNPNLRFYRPNPTHSVCALASTSKKHSRAIKKAEKGRDKQHSTREEEVQEYEERMFELRSSLNPALDSRTVVANGGGVTGYHFWGRFYLGNEV